MENSLSDNKILCAQSYQLSEESSGNILVNNKKTQIDHAPKTGDLIAIRAAHKLNEQATT